MANLSHIRSKAEFIGTLNPRAWDAVNPHTPFVFSNAHVELLVADAVKSVAVVISNKALAREVMDLSKGMAKQAGASLLASWEPGDEICPPWPWPWPGPRPWVLERFDPEPAPWKPVLAAEQIELAHILTRLAGLTSSKEFNAALKGAAVKLAGVAANTMLDEFERCGTVPRKPFPPRR
ncbi:MAG: hypothetical protein ACKV2U_25060 [Bryobacteraceae bacterium]